MVSKKFEARARHLMMLWYPSKGSIFLFPWILSTFKIQANYLNAEVGAQKSAFRQEFQNLQSDFFPNIPLPFLQV